MEWPDEAGRRLAALGPSVEILEPVELRGRVARAARDLLAHYGDDPVPSPVHADAR